jgi:hypothetical protein
MKKLRNARMVATGSVIGFVSSAGRVLATKAVSLGSMLQPEIQGRGLASWQDLIPRIITLVFVVSAAVTLFFLIAGAIKWITSGGDKGKVEEARGRITAAVIGLLILAVVWALFQLLIQVAFGTNVENITLPTLTDPTINVKTDPTINEETDWI